MSRDSVVTQCLEPETIGRVRAMATDIVVRAVRSSADTFGLPAALADALAVFGDVEAACTRFDPASPLMRANASPTESHGVPVLCFEAIREAYRHYVATGGRFDPRVLADLVAMGYDRSFTVTPTRARTTTVRHGARRALPRWEPRFWEQGCEVVLGPLPVDLGGIGKGLAVRWASAALRRAAPDHLVDAGGDLYCSGSAPDGQPWRVAVEDPFGDPTPRAVLVLSDLACATSSIRLRRWVTDGERVHHLVDPRSGRPGGDGLHAVTVVMADPAEAEVQAKVLFLAGRDGVEAAASRSGLAALWVDERGVARASRSMEPFVQWGPR